MNKLLFQINNGEPVEFANVEEGETFNLSITQFPTEEELKNGDCFAICFTDKEGNTFKIKHSK